MVRNILLIRHADANYPDQHERDFERKLSRKGTDESVLLGSYVQKLPFQLQAIYTSPAVRTLETCRNLVQTLDYMPRIISSEEYYEATRNVMVAAINRIDELFHNVAIVAHNPSITSLYEYLSQQSVGGFMTASCAWIQVDVEHWNEVSGGIASLRDYYYPGMLTV